MYISHTYMQDSPLPKVYFNSLEIPHYTHSYSPSVFTKVLHYLPVTCRDYNREVLLKPPENYKSLGKGEEKTQIREQV